MSPHAAPGHGHSLTQDQPIPRRARVESAQRASVRGESAQGACTERARRASVHRERAWRACVERAHTERAHGARVHGARVHGSGAPASSAGWSSVAATAERDQRAPAAPAPALPAVRRIPMLYIRGSSTYTIPRQGHVCAHRRGGPNRTTYAAADQLREAFSFGTATQSCGGADRDAGAV